MDEFSREGKTDMNILGWKDQKKTVAKSDKIS